MIAAVNNSMEKKHFLEQDDFVTYEKFASMLAKKEKKMLKKVSVKHVKEEQEQAIGRMKYYDHDAKELYFYTTMATTDIKG